MRRTNETARMSTLLSTEAKIFNVAESLELAVVVTVRAVVRDAVTSAVAPIVPVTIPSTPFTTPLTVAPAVAPTPAAKLVALLTVAPAVAPTPAAPLTTPLTAAPRFKTGVALATCLLTNETLQILHLMKSTNCLTTYSDECYYNSKDLHCLIGM